MAENDFLSFLVDETLRLQKRGEEKLSSFEHKLNDYGLSFWKGEFIPQMQVLRFRTPMGAMDVPMNWSVFAFTDSDYRILDKDNDQDNFFTVVNSAWKNTLSKVVIMHADGFCFLVGLNQEQVSHLQALLNPQEWLKSA